MNHEQVGNLNAGLYLKLAVHPAVRVFARTGSADLLPVAFP